MNRNQLRGLDRRLTALETAVARPEGAMIDVDLGDRTARLAPLAYREFIDQVREVLDELEALPMELPGPESGAGRPGVVKDGSSTALAAPPGAGPPVPIEDNGLDWLT